MKLSNRLIAINGDPDADDGWGAYYKAIEMQGIIVAVATAHVAAENQ